MNSEVEGVFNSNALGYIGSPGFDGGYLARAEEIVFWVWW